MTTVAYAQRDGEDVTACGVISARCVGHDRFLPLELFGVADLPSRSVVC